MNVLILDLWTGEYDIVSIEFLKSLMNSDEGERYAFISVDL